MKLLDVRGLCVQRGGRAILKDITFSVSRGEIVALIGANGAGKTTLMRASLGLLPHTGESSLARMPAQQRARAAAWLPQSREIAWDVDVATLVALGRTPHAGPLRVRSDADRAAVRTALDRTGLAAAADRPATGLSGGEQARVLIARALAQEAPLLMADEPVAGLDPAHQISTMQTFEDLAGSGTGIVVSLHDLGLVARHATRVIILAGGAILADGPPADVLSPDHMRTAFGVEIWRSETPHGPIVQPVRRTS